MKNAKYNLTDEGDLMDYLGVDIERDKATGQITMTQYKLIRQILDDVNFQKSTTAATHPALISEVLTKCEGEEKHKADCNYRSIIGKLNFLEKSTRPDLAFATHNAARHSADPRKSHSKAVLRICRYLQGTQDKGLILKPDMDRQFEVFVDADWAGLWDKASAEKDMNTARSRSGFLITYAKCPVLWQSKLQTEIALSTTEAEYICLSEALRHVIPLMNITQEIYERGLITQNPMPIVKCKAFEDNSGALELATAPKMRPRTKHINIKYNHFRSEIGKRISIEHISTEEQLADLFTKAVRYDLFLKFRKAIMGW